VLGWKKCYSANGSPRTVLEEATYLGHIEEVRHCTTTTRNQRLAAIRALAGFVSEHSPEHIAWCGEIRRIPY